jgi:AcrR family transcriptional regulator
MESNVSENSRASERDLVVDGLSLDAAAVSAVCKERMALVQIKKPDIRQAILEGAFTSFSRNGYASTSVADIAAAANITASNVYVYFPSKLHILYDIYRPWLTDQLLKLQKSIRRLRSPRLRLRRIFIGLWSDIPAADHCFANALMEALASSPPGAGKVSDLLAWSEGFLTDLLRECLPEDRQQLTRDHILSHILWMAFDGFAMNTRVGDTRNIETLADYVTDLLLAGSVGATLTEATDASTNGGTRRSGARARGE